MPRFPAEPLMSSETVPPKLLPQPSAPTKRPAQVIFWLSIVFCVACWGQWIWKTHGPRLVVLPSAKFDFGESPIGTRVTHRFQLHNAGWQPLEVKAVKKSCGCLGATLSAADNRIAPRGTADLDITVALDGKPGPKTVIVTLESNDERQPLQTLEIRGTVTAESVPAVNTLERPSSE